MSKPETIKIDEVEYVRASAALKYERKREGAWEIGEPYFIRTVTMYLHGVLVAVTEHELVLHNAAWIADTGRFSDFLRGVEPSEVEPFPDGEVIVGRGSITDAVKRGGSFRTRK